MKNHLRLLVPVCALGTIIGAPAHAMSSGTSLSVTVTSGGQLTSTYPWTIGVAPKPLTQTVPSGSSASVTWTITATKGTAVAGASFEGQVCVTNTGSEPTQSLSIQDQLFKGQTLLASAPVSVAAQPALNPGQAYCYPYVIAVPAAAIVVGATYTDVATVTITNKLGHVGSPFGKTVSAKGTLPATPTVINGTISVSDTNGKTFTFLSSGSQSYGQIYNCSAPSASTSLTDTATIASTRQTAQGSASITCGASVTYYRDSGPPQSVVIDLSGSSFEALTFNGSYWISTPGSGTSSGTFTFPGLPSGPYWLHLSGYSGNNYIATDTSSPPINLSTSVLGRPDETPLDASLWSSTTLNAALGNLAPWQSSGSTLELYAPGVNDWAFGLESLATSGAPIVGDSSLNLSFDMRAFNCCGSVNLLDGGKGDNVYLAELSPARSANGVPYAGVNRIAQTSAPVQQGAGTSSSLFAPGANFTDVSGSNSVSLDFRTTQFKAVLDAGNPNQSFSCNLCGATAAVVGLPGTNTFGLHANSADLLLMQLPAGAADTATGTMYFGAPFAGSWSRSLYVRFASQLSFTLPGTVWPTFFTNGLFMVEDTSASAAPVVPMLSAAQNVQINGSSFYANQYGLGNTPTLSWLPPGIGTPDYYRIDVYSVYYYGTHTLRKLVASFYTKSTSLTFPPGVIPSTAFIINLQPTINSNGIGAPFLGSNPEAAFVSSSGLLHQ